MEDKKEILVLNNSKVFSFDCQVDKIEEEFKVRGIMSELIHKIMGKFYHRGILQLSETMKKHRFQYDNQIIEIEINPSLNVMNKISINYKSFIT